MITTTTLNTIRAASPCHDGWTKLLKHLGKTSADDEPLLLLTVLDSNDLDDALWVLDNTKCDPRLARHFGAWCAEQVLPIFEAAYPNDMRPRQAIAVARDDNATDEDREAAWDAAWDASRATDKDREATWAAARAAAGAAGTAGTAARAAAGAAWAAAWDAWDAWAAAWAAWDAWDAWAAAWDASRAAGTAAWDASRAASRAAQTTQLRKMLMKGF